MLSYPKLNRLLSAALLSALCLSSANAQLSKNPNKFLGNITTYGNVNGGGMEYKNLWNQITPENETKWASVEGTRGSYRFNTAAYDYAKQNNLTFKFHTLVWGSQYPEWFTNKLSVKERKEAIIKWMDAVKRQYPDLKMIDVVNEAVGTHQAGNPLMKESLGGGGLTGYDWLIEAFEQAHKRWPDAILIYNDFNTFQYDTDAYINLVRTLRDAGAPIDAYGCQSHDVDNISKSNLQTVMKKIQDAVKLPMYITELDINIEDDSQQKTQFENIFPVMWEADYCAGVTLWGYIYGATWVDHSGLYKNGAERPAMTWLKSYMNSNAAKTAKGPFPGGQKQISLYIKPSTISASRGDTLDITVRAELVDKNKSIDSVKLYVKGVLDTIMTEAPYVAKYVPTVNGKHALKAIVYSNGTTYEREGAFTAYNPRSTYGSQPISLPGTLQAEHFDNGGDGVTYHDNDSNNQGDANFRTGDGVDVVKGNGGMAIGYTNADEWMEYTVDIAKTGYYYYNAVASSGTTGSGFKLSLNTDEGLVDITPNISVPQTANNDWGTYRTLTGKTLIPLEQGRYKIRLTITGNSCNIDRISFEHIQIDETLDLKISATPTPTAVGSPTLLSFTTIDPERDGALKSIKVYVNDKQVSTLTTRPFQLDYKPNTTGNVKISAVAVDTLKHESNMTSTTIYVNQARSTFKSVTIPGTLEAEDFDRCCEGITYHDNDSIDEGAAYPRYRNDNEGVDIVRENGIYAIGYTEEGEWLEYTVNFQQSGYYYARPTVSFENDSASFRIGIMDDQNQETVLAEFNYNDIGLDYYYTLTPIYFTENINAGKQRLRVTITGGGVNLDKFNIRFNVPTGAKYVTADDINANGTRYNLGGVRVNGYQKGISIIDGKKVYITE